MQYSLDLQTLHRLSQSPRRASFLVESTYYCLIIGTFFMILKTAGSFAALVGALLNDAILTTWSYLGLLVTAIFTLLTPLAASIHLYCLYAVRITAISACYMVTRYCTVLYCAVLCYTVLYCMFQVRILCGLGEGVTAPAMFAMLARWSAPQERSRCPLIRA